MINRFAQYLKQLGSEQMKNPAASGQRAVGLLATSLRPKPYSGFFRIKLEIARDEEQYSVVFSYGTGSYKCSC
jgi:hypothetical protein